MSRWLTFGSGSGTGVAYEYDSALAMLDGLASPFLEPFVDGLKVIESSARYA